MNAGSILLALHNGFQRATLPFREWKTKRALKAFTAPLDRQEAKARRLHQPVRHIQAARAALIVHALSHPQGN